MKKVTLIFYLIYLLTACIVSSAYGCTTIIVGKKASQDGSVLFGHNEDDSGRRVVNIWRVPRIKHQPDEMVRLVNGDEIPQVEETWSLLWFQVNGLKFSDYFMNEWGVCVGTDACRSREEQTVIDQGRIGYMLRRIVAERAKTAREGVTIAGELLDKLGYASSGRTMAICDAEEGWLLSIVAGKHWVAQRVPDDEVAILPNT